MRKSHTIALLLIVLVSFVFVSAVAASDAPASDLPTFESLEGTIVDYDPVTGTLTLVLADGTIETIMVGIGDFDHPIVALLAAYFGGAGVEDWAAALDTLSTELAFPEGTAIADIQPVTDADGNITGWQVTLDDGTIIETTPEQAAALADSFEVLTNVTVNTTGDGGTPSLVDVGQQIEAYHDAGIGFGVQVKIWTIAQESAAACEGDPDPTCAITIEELAQMVLDGFGIGQLFATYGKPSLLGVGHVRKALGTQITTFGGSGESGDGGSGDGQQGICNARSHGGNANAKGQNVSC